MTRIRFKLVASLALAAATATLLTAQSASAQRGPSFMNSPGYQRALTESRKQRQSQPMAKEDAVPQAPVSHRKRKVNRRH